MKKRIMALLLALCMLLSICVPVAVADDEAVSVPACDCLAQLVNLELKYHGSISGHCSRKEFADGELTQSAAYLAKHWNEYPADVITYLTEKLQSDYASKYEDVLRLRKIADCRPKPQANDLHVSVGGYTPSVEINGTNIYMDQYAKVALTAADGATWQIQLGDDTWTDITGAGSSLTVNYGLAASLLDANNCINLRAYGTYVDNGAECRAYSDVFTVRFKLNGEDAARRASIAAVSQHDADEATVSTSTTATTTSNPADAPAPLANEATVGTLAPVPVFAAPLDAARDGEATATTTTAAPAADDDTSAASETTNPDVKKTYNIVINYVFENNEQVAAPYTANLAEGSSFSATVTFPTVQGYLPYVGETQQDSYTFNIASVTEDVTINVVYKPTNVNYTVIHYKQNVANDQYTVAATETLQGLTASQVPEVHKTYEGFYNLIYERPAIAADGSTVIEVYYDRYYYLLNFDMDGGYGTDPVYARYGASIGTVNNPTKAGYTFGGWAETADGTTAVNLPTTMPAANKTYYAIWTVNDTAKVTVVFWGENADDEGYSYLADQTKVINLKPGREFTYSENEMLVCDKEVHTHTGDCIGCGKTEHTHTAYTQRDGCYELTCTIESHTHGTNCYAGVGDENNLHLSAPDNPQEGQVYHSDGFFGAAAYTIIYIKGTWYNYTGSTASGSVAPTTCGKAESAHTHNNTCYTLTCTTEVHTHDQKCYTCGKEQHTHNSDCYMQGAGLDSRLWKFVKSDTITVAADGSSVVNVYYDRTTFKLSFYSRDGNTLHGTIEDKWGAQIGTRYLTINSTAGGNLWMTTRNGNSGPYTAFLELMPAENRSYYLRSTSTTEQKVYYYVQNLEGTGYEEKYVIVAYSSSSLHPTEEDFMDIEGFTFEKAVFISDNREVTVTEKGEYDYNYNNAKFYYTRNSYKLTFNDQYKDVDTKDVKFEAPLSTYKDYVPEVPSAYEPGSVEFGGWYQNPQCTGEEYKLDEHKMPANDIILYAKWVPVNRTVEFYLTESSTEVYKPAKAETEASFTIPHGDNIAEEYVKNHLEKSAMNEAKPNGDYTFVMWYYYEDGVKKPFDPTMQIRKDLTLYGEWSSNTLKNYTVQYVLKDDHSVKVADDLTGSGLAGTTKTFDVKGGTDLYAEYQEGYFPTVQSQSLLLDIDKETLTITFEYVPMPAVPYTVCYVEKDTGNSLADDKVVSDNRKAVVTETFVPISGYMPDAYQKRLVVTADGENILYFYYTKDTEHALYIVKHFTQNTDGTTWTEHASSTATGDIGNRYTASPMTIPGYTHKETKYVVNGTEVTDVTAEGAKLTENGLEINLYYVRNNYPYQVRYLEQGTGKQLDDPKNGTGKYGEVISESAIDIDGYEAVAPTSATLNIRIDEGEGEGAPKLNIITFYYKEAEVTINYVAVGPTGATNFGSVNPTTETVKVKSGTAQGSTPTAGTGYKFVGWYKDAACTQPVDATWVTDNKLTPAKTDGKNVAATYYAKFEADTFDLTITKAMATGSEPYSDGDSFIFTVTKTDDSSFKLEVVLKAGESVTIKGLKAGTYTVTEDTGWSWRYTPVATTEDPVANGKTVNGENVVAGTESGTVTFTNKLEKNKWLGEQTSCENYWTGDTKEPIKQNPVYPIQKKEEVGDDPNANFDDEDDLIIWPR